MSELAASARKSHRPQPPVGPYSRRLQRGSLGDLYDGRSVEGRFIRHLERELLAHCGGSPSIVERLLIDRVIRIRLQLDALDGKLATGSWTPHDARTFGGLQNAMRLCLRELGRKPVSAASSTRIKIVRTFVDPTETAHNR